MGSFVRSVTVRLRRHGQSATLQDAFHSATLVAAGCPVEEETLPDYRPCDFYPVHVGLLFNGRYRVLAKLGYGGGSTVWFCRDQLVRRYVAVKVCSIRLSDDGRRDLRPRWEWKAYSRLSGMTTDNKGAQHVRQILDRFTIGTANGVQHQCFVYEVAAVNLQQLERTYPNQKLPFAMAKDVLRAVLHALDFLHTEAGIVHTDIKKDNIFFPATEACVAQFAKALHRQRPVARYDENSNRLIYQSVHFTDLLKGSELSLQEPLLGDLGEAQVLWDEQASFPPSVVGPEPFRSPESIFGMPWGCAVDTWMLGHLAVSMASHQFLLDARKTGGRWSTTKHVRQMVALMGPPPPEYAGSRTVHPKIWEELLGSAKLRKYDAKTMDARMGVIPDVWMQDDLVGFLHRIFKWRPGERASAAELLRHRFLQAG
ncbi:hypothetical protein BAUCODRAFT_274834 [Baudoinia panamericana UAMH 10762]|uniref:non-specific serine/threonine protein kinase n=1 Tax=Baudoinia panamericana (strain UAMH 10762) TaxID=717646 RepID=M2LDK0_BAUPA|nr:uncharacterized protein BAUCODRAFT_274834 [Baudoinia panamericana UAMH 10762]EMC92052.1 hypothetical protein BAUCODRAFT_274834 [Baudoinia panamericana UAMH 10762]